MEVYRIVLKKWSGKLTASGNSARWNSKDNKVIYTAESRALACLENLAHSSGEELKKEFAMMLIEIPAALKIERIEIESLPDNWFEFENLLICRSIGNKWLMKKSSAVLRVPSVIIANEFNYLINPEHPDFKKIKLTRNEDFRFDPRIITS